MRARAVASRQVVTDFIIPPSGIVTEDTVFKPLAEIQSDKVRAELDDVLAFLCCHTIHVDCLPEVSDEELYRFITTELIDEEIDDLKMDFDGDSIDDVEEAFQRRKRRELEQARMAGAGDRAPVQQVVRSGVKVGRNDPCPCGSGKNYKKCCGANG